MSSYSIWSGNTALVEQMRREIERSNLVITPQGVTPRIRPRSASPKHHNQVAKGNRRRASGKPSYRQRQASARAAKAQRPKLLTP